MKEENFDKNNIFEYLSSMFENLMNNVTEHNKDFGFSISIGPDGVPKFKNLSNENLGSNMFSNQFGYDTPIMDIVEHDTFYEILVETPGITNNNQVKIEVEDNKMVFSAVNGDIKYRKNIQFNRLLENNPEIAVKNRTCVIKIMIQN